MAKKWTDEEIQFLKFAYPSKDFTSSDISKALGRSIEAIHSKAHDLNIKRYKKQDLEGNLKRCTKCKTLFDVSMFYTNGEGRLHSWCKECKRINYKERTAPKERTVPKERTAPKKCTKCGELKNINCFYKSKRHKKDGYNNICKVCKNELSNKSKLKLLKERGW